MADRGGSTRQKWIDQAQSLNLYMAARRARSWTRCTSWPGCGLKTTYYLRTMAATQIEKSTVFRARALWRYVRS